MPRFLTALLFVVCFSGLFAQTRPGPKVTSYSPFSQKEEDDTVRQRPALMQNIKYNFSALLRGAFVMGYERALTEHFSLEGEIGLTYRDLFFELRNNMDNDGVLFNENSQTLSGVYISARAKFFLNGKFPEGFYISPMVRYRSYNFKHMTYTYPGDEITLKYNYHMKEAGLQFGYQIEGWIWDVIWDYSLGFGFQQGAYDTYPDFYTNDFTKKTKKTSYPMVYMGIKMGVPF